MLSKTSLILLFTACALSAGAQQSPNFLETNDFPPEYQKVQVKLGFNLGWDSPYSAGLECAVLFSELIDLNTGVGIGISGAKVGGGIRYYPLRKPSISPLVGMVLFRSTGIGEMLISDGVNDATYRLTPQTAILANTGFRWRFGHGNYLTVATGYVVALSGERAILESGYANSDHRTAVLALATGGFSFNVGIQIKLTKGNYKH